MVPGSPFKVVFGELFSQENIASFEEAKTIAEKAMEKVSTRGLHFVEIHNKYFIEWRWEWNDFTSSWEVISVEREALEQLKK